MVSKGLAHCVTLRSQVQKTKEENRISAREDNDSNFEAVGVEGITWHTDPVKPLVECVQMPWA